MDYLKHTFACNKLGLYDGCHFVIEQFMSLSRVLPDYFLFPVIVNDFILWNPNYVITEVKSVCI